MRDCVRDRGAEESQWITSIERGVVGRQQQMRRRQNRSLWRGGECVETLCLNMHTAFAEGLQQKCQGRNRSRQTRRPPFPPDRLDSTRVQHLKIALPPGGLVRVQAYARQQPAAYCIDGQLLQ